MMLVCPASNGVQAIARVGREAYATLCKHAAWCWYKQLWHEETTRLVALLKISPTQRSFHFSASDRFIQVLVKNPACKQKKDKVA